MQFIVEETESHLHVTVTEARIDAAIATQFKDKLREIVVGRRKPVHLDMAAVDFMDSSGLGAMIAVRKSLPETVELVLLALTPNVERVFRLTRMDSVFDIRPAVPASHASRPHTAQKEQRE
ncbi:STAS domain-containing protein [Paracoccus sp. ME4]|mgnify:FL=1|uniref:STAS domain-containing protein n=1 Tax=Paracoccus sp. ME4 TaxID=3138066 RepID=UPI00398B94D9